MLRLMMICVLLLVPTFALANTIECVSVSNSGAQADGVCGGSFISADGRFVAFHSTAPNLTREGKPGVFVRDRKAQKTEYIGRGDWCHGISADGRYVLFTGKASGKDRLLAYLYVRDRISHHTELVSVTSHGVPMHVLADHPGTAALSANGQAVIFLSPDRTSLTDSPVSFDSGGLPYVRDRRTRTTECVSVNDKGKPVYKEMCHGIAISGDGRFIALKTSDLLTADPNAGIFVRDRRTKRIERVNLDGKEKERPAGDCFLSISTSGRYVCFAMYRIFKQQSRRGIPYKSDIYLRDRKLGTTDHISASTTQGFASESASFGSVSADGRFVTFFSSADNLTQDDVVNGSTEPESITAFFQGRRKSPKPSIFLRDRRTNTTERIAYNVSTGWPLQATMSADGRFVAYIGLPPGVDGTRSSLQVLVCDRGKQLPGD